MDSISVILFKVLNFTNLVCTTKFFKSFENFQLYGTTMSELQISQNLAIHTTHLHSN